MLTSPAQLRPPPAPGGNESLTLAEQALLRCVAHSSPGLLWLTPRSSNTQRTLASLVSPDHEPPSAHREARPSPPAAPPPSEPVFQILLRSSNDNASKFRVKNSTRLGKVFDAFVSGHPELAERRVRFFFDGDVVSATTTAGQLGLGDGDVLDVKCTA